MLGDIALQPRLLISQLRPLKLHTFILQYDDRNDCLYLFNRGIQGLVQRNIQDLYKSYTAPRDNGDSCLLSFEDRANQECVGITALRTVNLTQLGSVAITDDQSWMFSRHCTGGKLSFGMANKLTDGGNGSVDTDQRSVRTICTLSN